MGFWLSWLGLPKGWASGCCPLTGWYGCSSDDRDIQATSSQAPCGAGLATPAFSPFCWLSWRKPRDSTGVGLGPWLSGSILASILGPKRGWGGALRGRPESTRGRAPGRREQMVGSSQQARLWPLTHKPGYTLLPLSMLDGNLQVSWAASLALHPGPATHGVMLSTATMSKAPESSQRPRGGTCSSPKP
jgi:hypothetical protein